jgi:dienelactone hydrolase
MKKHRRLKIALIVVAAVLLVLAGSFGIYVSQFYHAQEQAKAILSDGTDLAVFSGGIAVGPADAKVGFIFYPGGKVEYTAYLPLLKRLSQSGVLCVLAKMPFNLAVFDISAAGRLMAKYPGIEHWYIGGHSLGGSMAAAFAADHASQLNGLVLLASYSASDLSDTSLRVLALIGSEDHVLNRDNLVKARDRMPADYQEKVIEGGNHGQFGDYGIQAGDGTALITREEQTALTTDKILEFFKIKSID